MAEFYDKADGGLLDFIGDIYKCAVEPDRRPSVLERASHLVNGSAATVTVHGPAGIILTDALGKIVFANDIAERMLDGRVLLCLEDELSARDSKSASELRAAIATAGKVANSRDVIETSFVLAKGRATSDLAIWVAALDARLTSGSVSPFARVAIFALAANAPQTSPRRLEPTA